MTKKVGPEQQQHLDQLEQAKAKLRRIRSREDEAMKEVHDLIKTGFDMDISGNKLSKASGLSLPRVYQIRDGDKPRPKKVVTPEPPHPAEESV
jgi:hypothetical protein